MGSKAHVYDADGNNLCLRRGKDVFLDNELQKKTRVPESVRAEPRDIHRPQPPGLKGFLGAEYSNDYWKMDGVVPRTKMRMSKADLAEQALLLAAERSARLGKPKSFKQKRFEEDLFEQQSLVHGLTATEYDYVEDDEDRPVVEPDPAE